MDRREFCKTLGLIGLAPGISACVSSIPDALYPASDFGNVTLLHLTDCHAQLLPIYYREPSRPFGISPYHKIFELSGQSFLKFFGFKPGTREAYAFTHLNFAEGGGSFWKNRRFCLFGNFNQATKKRQPTRKFFVAGRWRYLARVSDISVDARCRYAGHL